MIGEIVLINNGTTTPNVGIVQKDKGDGLYDVIAFVGAHQALIENIREGTAQDEFQIKNKPTPPVKKGK